MEGGDGNDLFAGDTPGTNTLRGGAGNDTMSAQIDQAASADRFDGGPGRDTANYENRTERVRVSITNSSPPNDGKDGEGDDLDNVETYIGGSGNDDLRAFDFVNAPQASTSWATPGTTCCSWTATCSATSTAAPAPTPTT